ncbi:rCG49665 [Rattus norvegicus]|uniref:RCG49665 n=1 Tax=Rattus norvegicus TaxID=10116 RepID=A6K2M0_RAT|nr:rCG49665 [Rattus norvegicus]
MKPPQSPRRTGEGKREVSCLS